MEDNRQVAFLNAPYLTCFFFLAFITCLIEDRTTSILKNKIAISLKKFS